jgi:hypothetical protein
MKRGYQDKKMLQFSVKIAVKKRGGKRKSPAISGKGKTG